MLNCIVIEDDAVQRNLISAYINNCEGLFVASTFEDAISAKEQLASLRPDIIFLDVQLPGMNGIEFIKECKPEAKVILFSGSSDFALDGFECNVVDYLLKPCTYERFKLAVERTGLLDPKTFLLVKDKGEHIKVRFDEICIVQSNHEYVIIYTKEKRYVVYSNMANILKKLPQNFIRIHRSTIINLDEVKSYSSDYVALLDKSYKVSRSYSKNLKMKLKDQGS